MLLSVTGRRRPTLQLVQKAVVSERAAKYTVHSFRERAAEAAAAAARPHRLYPGLALGFAPCRKVFLSDCFSFLSRFGLCSVFTTKTLGYI